MSYHVMHYVIVCHWLCIVVQMLCHVMSCLVMSCIMSSCVVVISSHLSCLCPLHPNRLPRTDLDEGETDVMLEAELKPVVPVVIFGNECTEFPRSE